MSAETDVLVAWKAKWDATPALAAAVPGGLHPDQVPEPQPPAANRPLPYAVVSVTLARAPKTYFRFFTAYHRVTVEVYGNGAGGKQALGDVVSLLHQTYDPPPFGTGTLTIPGTAAVHAFTLGDGPPADEKPTEVKRQGAYLRLARLAWVVVTERLQN